MFTTGFSMDAKTLAESWSNSKTLDWLIDLSVKNEFAICGSFIVEENGSYYNRFTFVTPEKKVFHYDKRHLFRMAKEDEHFSSGNTKEIIDYKGWKICPMVCYDLRFPVWSRNINMEYDLLIYVANWPERRSMPWNTLLKARAIENLCYVAGVNRVGTDGNDIYYSGDTSLIDFKGQVLCHQKDTEDIATQTLEKKELTSFRKTFPANMDSDDFTIN